MANLFPLLTGAAFDDLVADIKANGLREPVLLDSEGRILDGRNRYRACLAAGVEPRFATWEGEGSAADLVLSLNLHRRHLNESQRAMVAARLAKMMEKEAVKRRSRLVADLQRVPRGRSSAEAGARINVSPRLIGHAIKVLREGCPGLIAAVESGELAVSPAASLTSLTLEEQARVVAGGAAEIAAKVRQLRNASSGSDVKPSPGTFGVLHQATLLAGAGRIADADSVAFLWVASSALPAAIAALEARGFEHATPGEG